jgi:cytochrome c peroxidase
MKLKLTRLIIVFLFFAFTVAEVYQLQYPAYFPKPVYDFKKNPLNVSKITLGRTLFYDPILSKDNNISCASCHSSFNAFAHTDHALSHGINDLIGTRNAPSLMNLAWQSVFMWDGAINHLDVQALAPISHPKEMGEKIETVVAKLQNNKLYPKLFYIAFDDSIITGERVLKALSQFQLTLVSANSKYDRVKSKKEKFTEQEQKGYALFLKNCNACHTEPLFSNYTFANNGLPLDTGLKDFGKWMVTKQSADSLKFKIPSLRNLSYTYPYMHDGRFNKLNQVLNHYTQGIKQGPTLANELRNSIQLSSDEKVDLISFLLALNDIDFVFNPKHGFPKEILLQTEGKQK